MLSRKLDTKEYMQCNLIVKSRLKIGKTTVKKIRAVVTLGSILTGRIKRESSWVLEIVYMSITCKNSLAMYS